MLGRTLARVSRTRLGVRAVASIRNGVTTWTQARPQSTRGFSLMSDHDDGRQTPSNNAHWRAARRGFRSLARETQSPSSASETLQSTPSEERRPASPQQLFGSVVKIFCDHTDPNFCQAWQMRRQSASTGSGFIIDGQRIMTNAHCIAYHNRVLVRKHGDARRYAAKVEAVAHECDLALLSVDDPHFWKDVQPLTFGDVPELHDAVVVVGYPTGGDNLSITAGVVSRVDVTTYAHSNFKLLCAQIDAAINPGNSGGPAFKFPDGVVAGVAFQGYDDAQSIGYIVPTSVIRRFLLDVEKHHTSTGFVALGVTYQTLENEALRRFYGLDTITHSQLPKGVDPSGILIVQADRVRNKMFRENMMEQHTVNGASSRGPMTDVGLQKDDILLALNHVDVADDGTVLFRDKERVHVSHVVSDFFTGDSVPALILRDKTLMTVQVPLYPPKYLVPEHQWDTMPRYFIYGGLVFCPLTVDYLRDEFGKKYYEHAPTSLMEPLSNFFPEEPDEEVVILSQILASDLTIGYDLKNTRLRRVNQQRVKSLQHVVEILVADQAKPFAEFDFDYELRIILDTKATRLESPGILKQHAIPQPWSSDLHDIAATLAAL